MLRINYYANSSWMLSVAAFFMNHEEKFESLCKLCKAKGNKYLWSTMFDGEKKVEREKKVSQFMFVDQIKKVCDLHF